MYLRCDLKKKYEDAKAFCEQDNAHLVTISSQEEQDLVNGLPGYLLLLFSTNI